MLIITGNPMLILLLCYVVYNGQKSSLQFLRQLFLVFHHEFNTYRAIDLKLLYRYMGNGSIIYVQYTSFALMGITSKKKILGSSNPKM